VSTDYIVEVYYNNIFEYQMDAYDTFEEAKDVAIEHRKTLEPGEEIQVTIVQYDDQERETGITSERL